MWGLWFTHCNALPTTKQPTLMLKTWHKQFLRYVPLALALSERLYLCCVAQGGQEMYSVVSGGLEKKLSIFTSLKPLILKI